ncbi:hypothetical protein SAMN05443246_1081 [Paenibacillus sp. GP183]|jgi:hypothetical protein|nr:hypothetical protein SAMN05443246_1081 [Paenibacillus sp. GP183]
MNGKSNNQILTLINGVTAKKGSPCLENQNHFKDNITNPNYVIAASLAESEVPNTPGIYCIMIRDITSIPEPYSACLINRDHNILYVGQASTSLLKRLVTQDLRHKSPASFFRSIGAIFGYRPVIGSLSHSRNGANYKFSDDDTLRIIDWINKNLIINWIAMKSELLNDIEIKLILEAKPILNIRQNPNKLKELVSLRQECRMIAAPNSGGKHE